MAKKFINKITYKTPDGQITHIQLPTVGIDMTSLGDASLTKKGIVQLTSTPTEADETVAVTPKGVHTAIKSHLKNVNSLELATDVGTLYFVIEE